MNAIIVKKLDPRDTEAARIVIENSKGESASVDYMHRFLGTESNVLIAAFDGDDPVGFLLAYALARVENESAELFIYEIEVAIEYRRQGIGKTMLDMALEWMRDREMVGAFVITNYANRGAVEFYHSTGATIPDGDDLLFEYSGAQ